MLLLQSFLSAKHQKKNCQRIAQVHNDEGDYGDDENNAAAAEDDNSAQVPVRDEQLSGDRGDEELHQLQIRQVHQGRHEGIAADCVADADVDDFKLVWRYLETSMLVLILKNNLQAEFLRGKRKISEDEEAEDLSGIRGSLEENPGSNSNSSSSSQATGKRRPSESSVYNNTSPTHPAANTLSQPPQKSPNSFSRMRSPPAGFPNNPPVGPTSPVFVGGLEPPRGASSYGLSPSYGHPPSILSPPGINPGMVEVKSLKIGYCSKLTGIAPGEE